MRATLVAFIVLAMAAGARAGVYGIEIDGKKTWLTINTPAGWTESEREAPIDGLIWNFTPIDHKTNAFCELWLLDVSDKEYSTKKKLSRQVEDLARKMVTSLDPKLRMPDVKPFNCKQGFGFYYSLVDPSMAGKASQPGNPKQVTGGLIRLESGVVIEVRIASDGDKTEGYQQLLAMVEALQLKH